MSTVLETKLNEILNEKTQKIIPDNIKSGVTIFGVNGEYKGLDTSDATAKAQEIFKGKTAYVNGEKVVGTYEETGGGSESEYNTLLDTSANGNFSIQNNLTTVGDLDMTGVIYMTSTFENCMALSKVGKISNTDGITQMTSVFSGCKSLVEAPYFDMPNVTTVATMFSNCTSLKIVPLYNTSNVENMLKMFNMCSALEEVPKFDTSNVNKMGYMFYNCGNLKTVPLYNTSKVNNMEYMFYGCSDLEEIPEFDTSAVTNMANMFYKSGIKKIPQLNASAVANCNGMFAQAKNLTDFGGLLNLGKSFTYKGANYNYYALNLSVCSNLTHDSLMNIINNVYDLNLTYDVVNGGTLYTQKLQLGSTNLAKLTAEEIAIATAKGWTVS